MALGPNGLGWLDIGCDCTAIELFAASGRSKIGGCRTQSHPGAASGLTRCANAARQFPIAPADPGAPLPAPSFPGGFRTPALRCAWMVRRRAGIRNPSHFRRSRCRVGRGRSTADSGRPSVRAPPVAVPDNGLRLLRPARRGSLPTHSRGAAQFETLRGRDTVERNVPRVILDRRAPLQARSRVGDPAKESAEGVDMARFALVSCWVPDARSPSAHFGRG